MKIKLLFLLSIATAELFSANAGPAAVTTKPAAHIPNFFCKHHFDGMPQRHIVYLGDRRLLVADRRAVNGPAITQVSDELTVISEINFDRRSPFNTRWLVTSLSRMQNGSLIIGATDVTGEDSTLTIVPSDRVKEELRSYQGIEYSQIKPHGGPTCKPATAGDLFAFGHRTGVRVHRIDCGTSANDQSIGESKERRKKEDFESRLAHLTATGIDSLSFASGDNTRLAASFKPEGGSSVVQIFDLAQSKTQSTIEDDGENLSGKEKVIFSPEDPNLLAVVGAAAVKLYDLRDKEKKPVTRIQFHTDNTPTSCSWDSQTRLIVTSSLNQVMVINPKTTGYSCFELPEDNHPNATALVSKDGKDLLFVAGTQHLHRMELP